MENETLDMAKLNKKLFGVTTNKTFEYVVSRYLDHSILLEPLEKTRIICEAAMLSEEITVLYEQQLRIIHLLALSLASVREEEQTIKIPWGFSETEDSYNKFILPWLTTFPMPRYKNDQERKAQLDALSGKPPFEQFFYITSKSNLSKSSLAQLKIQFYVWAMPTLMKLTADLTKRLSPSSFLQALGLARGGKEHALS